MSKAMPPPNTLFRVIGGQEEIAEGDYVMLVGEPDFKRKGPPVDFCVVREVLSPTPCDCEDMKIAKGGILPLRNGVPSVGNCYIQFCPWCGHPAPKSHD